MKLLSKPESRFVLLILMALCIYWLRVRASWLTITITILLAILTFIIIPIFENRQAKPFEASKEQQRRHSDEMLDPSTQDFIQSSNQLFQKMKQAGFQSLSEAEQTFLCIERLETAINSDGIEEYLLSSFAAYMHETVDALKRIEAIQTAQLVENVISHFPNASIPNNEDERREAVEMVSFQEPELFNQFDELFLEYPEEIHRLLQTYLAKNKWDFQTTSKQNGDPKI